MPPGGSSAIKTYDLQYDLPPELIAQHPCRPRDAARLLVLDRRTGAMEHRIFRDLPEYLRPGDALVLNESKVLPARFVAVRRTGGRIGGIFLEETGAGRWTVMLTGVGRLTAGETLSFGEGTMTLLRRLDRGLCEVEVSPARPATELLDRIGMMPLPPYIRRENDADEPADRADYQTVYASCPGAVAAPTAGMHFTPELLERMRGAGVTLARVVLHVGLGTFQPVEVEDLAEHRMHREWYEMSEEAAESLRAARRSGGRIAAVGTTSVRVLETCGGGGPGAGSGWTDLLIQPPFDFRGTDALVTNFHLPGSTLLALVFALAGRELVLRAYEAAIREGYRFYSYGDAMLIL